MPVRPVRWFRDLRRVEKAFALALVISIALRLAAPGTGTAALFTLLAYLLGIMVALRLARTGVHRMIWRLRNRLIVAYLFIAVVPIGLILSLFGISGYWLTGQIAGYLIHSELSRRTNVLRRPAEMLARMPAANRADYARRIAPFLGGTFPELAVVVGGPEPFKLPPETEIEPPPAGWGDVHGVVVREGRMYGWAHATAKDGADITILAPLTRDFMANLMPGLGVVDLVRGSLEPPRRGGVNLRIGEKYYQGEPARGARRDRIPEPYIAGDIGISGYYPVACAIWSRPGATENGALFIQTRISAVLGQVFGHSQVGGNVEWGELIWWAFLAMSCLFLVVELISLVIGVSLTRTITSAVHQLYEGTERVKEGDFSHRIPVRGKDQLAELGHSFNTMTANLEQLIAVAKEKERLQSEIEIAREVQSQLFPKSVPDLKSLEMAGVCKPARMVSGDYYDFMLLPDASLAFAIGDVAGKGISAALLMAAIQSTIRTQLATAAQSAGNGGAPAQVSTARLVTLLNSQLYANTSPEKYATFYFALYEEGTHTLSYTNAGHVPPFLVRGGHPMPLEVTGTVVGAFPFAQYREQRVQLAPGDLVVTYTDGIIEPENEYGEMFGEERLKDILLRHSAAGCDEIIARTMEAVNDWTGAGELQDDMTMLVARRI
ncbi:MAG: SpoIIE family protein phosphatase [Bryobacteraceae bacterium]